MAEIYIITEFMDAIPGVFGNRDENAIIIEDAFFVRVTVRNESVCISGDSEENCKRAESVLRRLIELAVSGEVITRQLTAYLCDLAAEGTLAKVKDYSADVICLSARGKPLKAKTNGQKTYVDAIKNNTITFGIGPAGTGKTYLAVAMAVTAFKKNEVSRIILTRPAVEAGERLGFLPGDLQNKVDPYLRPLYDALYDVMGLESYQRNFEKGAIEIAPLAYMRGRTLDDAFIILDEAQNTTPEQLKMFLTRIGASSKAVVTGDVTQIDLPQDKQSGLKNIQKILKDIDDIAFVRLNDRDVVRHELVRKIISAYEKYDQARKDK